MKRLCFVRVILRGAKSIGNTNAFCSHSATIDCGNILNLWCMFRRKQYPWSGRCTRIDGDLAKKQQQATPKSTTGGAFRTAAVDPEAAIYHFRLHERIWSCWACHRTHAAFFFFWRGKATASARVESEPQRAQAMALKRSLTYSYVPLGSLCTFVATFAFVVNTCHSSIGCQPEVGLQFIQAQMGSCAIPCP